MSSVQFVFNEIHVLIWNMQAILIDDMLAVESACVSLADFYGKLNPVETARCILMAQMASMRRVSIETYLMAASLDNSERCAIVAV